MERALAYRSKRMPKSFMKKKIDRFHHLAIECDEAAFERAITFLLDLRNWCSKRRWELCIGCCRAIELAHPFKWKERKKPAHQMLFSKLFKPSGFSPNEFWWGDCMRDYDNAYTARIIALQLTAEIIRDEKKKLR